MSVAIDKQHNRTIDYFLADTWWYGLTDRISTDEFYRLAQQRKDEGFSAIQLVMGIPPEVAIDSPQSHGGGKPAFYLQESNLIINQDYIAAALEKIEILNKLHLKPIIYGGWGPQIGRIGRNNMIEWWRRIVKVTEKFDPIYCLTGEIDLRVHTQSRTIMGKVFNKFNISSIKQKRQIAEWLQVYKEVKKTTRLPVICHTTPNMDSWSISRDFSAITVQTGHSERSRSCLWMLPMKYSFSKKPFINLEPWYEGISNSFFESDQIFAFWVSILSGASAYCYGSHGIWNVGDGNFLAHWGRRTFQEAKKSAVPLKIGKSNRLFLCAKGFMQGNINSKASGVGDNVSIQMIDKRGRKIVYAPKGYSDFTAKDLIYDPSQCNFIKENIPDETVVLSGFTDIENRLLKQSVNSVK
jgi:hypothetical protein